MDHSSQDHGRTTFENTDFDERASAAAPLLEHRDIVGCQHHTRAAQTHGGGDELHRLPQRCRYESFQFFAHTRSKSSTYLSVIRAKEKHFMARSRAATAKSPKLVSAMVRTPSAKPSMSPSGTRQPVAPCSTISGLPPTR